MIRIKKKLQKYGYMLVCVILLFSACKKTMTMAEYLDLGEKYLLEQNYEGAIVAFSKAIEMEPKLLRAYQGLSEIYTKQGKIEEAEKIEESWLELYNNLPEGERTEELKKFFEELCRKRDQKALNEMLEQYKQWGEFASLRSFLEKRWFEDKEGSLEEELMALDNSMKLLEEIYTVCENETYDIVFDLMGQEGFLNLRELVKELEKPLIFEKGEKSLGIYYVNGDWFGNCMIYYGDYENGDRHGDGIWLGYAGAGSHAGISYQASGQWKNDKPNGTQEEIYISNEGRECITGTVENGLWNGEATWVHRGGEEYSVSFEHGKWIVLYVEEIRGQNQYYIADNGNSAISTSNVDYLQGIVGIVGFKR